MADFNTKGEPTIRRLLRELRRDIAELQVVDPRLELLRKQLLDLSLMVDEVQEQVRQLEKHEDTGLYIIRIAAMAAFVVLLVLLVRLI